MKRLYIVLCVSLLASNICAFTTHHLNPYDLGLLQHQQQQLQLQQQQQQLLQQQQELQQNQQQQDNSDSSDNGNDYGSSISGISSEDYDNHPQYSFGYNVHDALTGDEKHQEEQRNGDLVLGQYSVLDPDGTKRTVEYSADDANGFNAVVSRQNVGIRTTNFNPAITGSSSAATSSSRYNSFEAQQAQIEAQSVNGAQAQTNYNNQQQSFADAKLQAQADAHSRAMLQIQQQTEAQAKLQAENQQRIQAQQLMDQVQQQYRQQQQQAQRSQQQLLRARAQSGSLNHALHATVVAHPLLSRTSALTLPHPSLYVSQPASASIHAHVIHPYVDAGAYTTVYRNGKSQW